MIDNRQNRSNKNNKSNRGRDYRGLKAIIATGSLAATLLGAQILSAQDNAPVEVSALPENQVIQQAQPVRVLTVQPRSQTPLLTNLQPVPRVQAPIRALTRTRSSR